MSSELSEDWKAWKADARQRMDENEIAVLDELEEFDLPGVEVCKLTDYHFKVETYDGTRRVDIYPRRRRFHRVRGVAGPPRGTFQKHGLVAFLKNCFPAKEPKMVLGYYGGDGYGGCPEKGRYIVKQNDRPDKAFGSLTVARNFYDSIKDRGKAIWNDVSGEMLECHQMMPYVSPSVELMYHRDNKTMGWFDLGGKNLAVWQWHPVRAQYMTTLRGAMYELGWKHLYQSEVANLHQAVIDEVQRYGADAFSTYDDED